MMIDTPSAFPPTRSRVFVLSHESDPNRCNSSTSIIALALLRSLGRRGIDVVRVHPNTREFSLQSRYCSHIEISPDLHQSPQALLDFLLGMRQRYPGPATLIPASDDCAQFMARFHTELSNEFAVTAPSWKVMRLLIDKRRQYQFARQHGIPIPETYFPRSLREVHELSQRLVNYPYVIKPLVSYRWRLIEMQSMSRGKKGFAVATPDELNSRYREIAQVDPQVMIQEVIGGADDQLFTFLSYFDHHSQALAYCVRRKLRQLPLDFGYCTLTESCADATVVAQSLALLGAVGFHGISGVEWKLDPRTGVYKLIEVNARAVNTLALAGACGIDLPWIAYCDMNSLKVEHATEWKSGIRWINLTDDVWAARSLVKQQKLSWFQWLLALWRCRVDAVFAADDLRPFVSHVRQWLMIIRMSKSLQRNEPERAASRALPSLGQSADR